MANQKFILPPFNGDPKYLNTYLQQVFDLLWEMIQGGENFLVVPRLDVAPDKPFDGMLVYADGTNWDPGNGEGFYGYFGAAWNPLHT